MKNKILTNPVSSGLLTTGIATGIGVIIDKLKDKYLLFTEVKAGVVIIFFVIFGILFFIIFNIFFKKKSIFSVGDVVILKSDKRLFKEKYTVVNLHAPENEDQIECRKGNTIIKFYPHELVSVNRKKNVKKTHKE